MSQKTYFSFYCIKDFCMLEYDIDVTHIEELQTIRNTNQLENIFEKAKSTVVQGGTVNLIRKSLDGYVTKFDEITTEEDLSSYKDAVFKYL